MEKICVTNEFLQTHKPQNEYRGVCRSPQNLEKAIT